MPEPEGKPPGLLDIESLDRSDIETILDRALFFQPPPNESYRRLDALSSSPERNARHVLKVLLKFWLLQVGQAPMRRLIKHFERARYARIVHQRYFAHLSFDQVIERAVQELCAVGAAALDASSVRSL